jgi:hypothetical protein
MYAMFLCPTPVGTQQMYTSSHDTQKLIIIDDVHRILPKKVSSIFNIMTLHYEICKAKTLKKKVSLLHKLNI